ncbi:MAG: FMN-binding protein [Gemmatimonadota bacterium]
MCRSVTCSEPVAALLMAIALTAALWGVPHAAEGQVLLTQEEALRLAFPAPAEVERRTAFLDEAQRVEVERLAAPTDASERSVVTYYVGQLDGKSLGAAYFDAHRVRTLREVLMIVVDPAGHVTRIEILGFGEPPEYMAPDGWLELFQGRGLDGGTSIKGDIPIITGATLTARSVTGAVRRSLALHAVIRPIEAHASSDTTGSRH